MHRCWWRQDTSRLISEVGRSRSSQNENEYMYPTCALHGLNISLSSPTTLIVGDGGLLKHNAMQLLYYAYNLSQQYDSNSWIILWMLITGERETQMKCPVMTRWECVGEGVDHIATNREEWMNVSANIVIVKQSSSKKYAIASHLYSLLNEPFVIANTFLFKGYCDSWWNQHFQWQKHVDARAKLYGFLGSHMIVHYFVQSRNLKKISNTWITMKEFEPYLKHFSAVFNEYAKEDFARVYSERAIEIRTKYFK